MAYNRAYKTFKKEIRLDFEYEGEKFYALFDQQFVVNPAEPDVGIFNPYLELDGDPEDIHYYDSDDTLLIVNDYIKDIAMTSNFIINFYRSKEGQKKVEQACWESLEGED